MIDPHPRWLWADRTDAPGVWPDLVINFDRSGDPIIPSHLRSGTLTGIYCAGDQWDEDQMEDSMSPILWDDGLRR